MSCVCGCEEQYKIGDITYYPLAYKVEKIIIKDVPHYYCDACKSISYDLKTKIISVVRHAIKNNLNNEYYTNILKLLKKENG